VEETSVRDLPFLRGWPRVVSVRDIVGRVCGQRLEGGGLRWVEMRLGWTGAECVEHILMLIWTQEQGKEKRRGVQYVWIASYIALG